MVKYLQNQIFCPYGTKNFNTQLDKPICEKLAYHLFALVSVLQIAN